MARPSTYSPTSSVLIEAVMMGVGLDAKGEMNCLLKMMLRFIDRVAISICDD